MHQGMCVYDLGVGTVSVISPILFTFVHLNYFSNQH
jgi:hypothetical protein